MQESQPDEEIIEFASKLFGLAREGDAEQLAAYVDAGVDPNLSNHKGDSLVMLAAYHGHAAAVAASAPTCWRSCAANPGRWTPMRPARATRSPR